jgi:protein-disulfide isomerase/uncharacterized membrane protein
VPRTRRGLLCTAVLLSAVGLVVCLLLGWRVGHPSLRGVCGSGSGCERALASPYATILGKPLAWWGAAYFLTQLVLFIIIFSRQGGLLYRRLLRTASGLGLVGTLAAGLLLYVQLGVVRTFCPLCTVAVALVAALYVLVGRIPRGGEATPIPGQAVGLALGVMVAGLMVGVGFVLSERGEVVARIDGHEITGYDMRREMQLTLHQQAEQTYRSQRNWLGWKLENRVLGAEAERRGMTLEAWIAAEVDAGIVVSEAEVDARLAREPRAPSKTERRALARREVLANKRRVRRAQLTEELRKKHDIEVLLKAPVVPRVEIDTAAAHTLGPRAAPIHLVVFSEFQCPFCAQLAPVLARLHKAYPTDVAISFMHCPLEGHDRSLPAARASECAAAENKFWEFHDRLFEAAEDLSTDALEEHALALGLDREAYRECRVSATPTQAVRSAAQEARRLGITTVPSLFLDGRRIGGFVPFADLDRMVREARRGTWRKLLDGDDR